MNLTAVDYRGNRSFFTWDFVRPSFTMPFHFHPEVEIIFVRAGHCTLVINDTPIRVREGNIVIIGSDVPHSYHNSPGESLGPEWAKHTMVLFRPHFLGGPFLHAPEMKVARDFLALLGDSGIQVRGRTRTRVAHLMSSLKHEGNLPNLIGLLQILNVLGSATETEVRPVRPKPGLGPMHRQDMARLKRVFNHIRENLGEEIRLADIAAVAQLAPTSFSRFFRQKTGTTFHQYLLETRLSEAGMRLVSTQDSVTEICFSCGFGNLSNFNRQFQAHRGCTPTGFRKNWIEAESASKS